MIEKGDVAICPLSELDEPSEFFNEVKSLNKAIASSLNLVFIPFGSYAAGTFLYPQSDLDLLCVGNDVHSGGALRELCREYKSLGVTTETHGDMIQLVLDQRPRVDIVPARMLSECECLTKSNGVWLHSSPLTHAQQFRICNENSSGLAALAVRQIKLHAVNSGLTIKGFLIQIVVKHVIESGANTLEAVLAHAKQCFRFSDFAFIENGPSIAPLTQSQAACELRRLSAVILDPSNPSLLRSLNH